MFSPKFRRASEAHLYISEHVGSDLYCASIPEYHDLLDRQLQDFIVIGEMLAARPLIGSLRLFEEFRTRITSRYLYDSNAPMRFLRFSPVSICTLLSPASA